MCDFTRKAFELAFKYRNPAVVLADGVLGQMIESLDSQRKPLFLRSIQSGRLTAQPRQDLI